MVYAVKKVTQYKCEICGTLYADESECAKCESQHKIPSSIVRVDHRGKGICNGGYPPYILVSFRDGSERKYKREG